MIEVEKISPEVTRLTLNRPEKRNALTIEMLQQLSAAIDEANAEPNGRILILEAVGASFSAGLDLTEAADLTCAHPSAEWFARALERLALTPLLTIGAARGVAVAGGAGLLAACDFALASDDAKIGFPETRIGLVPAMVMTLLYHRIGDRALRELMLRAELISAQRAFDIGLLTRVVPTDQLKNEVGQLVESLLGTAPVAAASTKRLIRDLRHPDLASELQQVIAFHLQARTSEEAEEGVLAFNQGRKPHWRKK